MPAEEKGGFFGDPQQYLIKVLLALVPMVTLVPLVINKIDKIARICMLTSYRIFVMIYFILPVVLISAWVVAKLFHPYRIRPDIIPGSPENKPPLYQTLLSDYSRSGSKRTYSLLAMAWGFFLLVATLCFLFIDSSLFTYLFLGCSFLLLTGVGILIFNLARRVPYYRQDIDCGPNDDRDKLLEKFSGAHTQWWVLIVLCTIAISWAGYRLTFSEAASKTNRPDPKTAFYLLDNNDTIRALPELIDSFQKSQHLFALAIEIADRGKTADSMSLPALKKMMAGLDLQIGALNQFYRDSSRPGSDTALHCPNTDSLKPYILRKHFADIANSLYLLRLYPSDTTWAFLTAYLNRLKELSFNASWYASGWDDHTRHKWSDILQGIQFKGFILFFMTLLVLFTAWFFSLTEDLRRQALQESSHTGIISVGRRGRDRYEVHEKETYRPFPILFALSRSTTILILLVIPFFKAITPASINLDQPFLSEPAAKLLGDWEVDRSSAHNQPMPSNTPAYTHLAPDTVYFKDSTLKRENIITQKLDLKNDTTIRNLLTELRKYKPNGQVDSDVTIIKAMLTKMSRR
ncbi:MAG TPA: hypothetical protein VNS58_08535 [Puia sp.]|nr:hypothetical protein [Puia sp.]